MNNTNNNTNQKFNDPKNKPGNNTYKQRNKNKNVPRFGTNSNRYSYRRNVISQNVIKYNRPKNVIQRNFNQNNKNSIIRGKDLVISTNNNLVNQDSGVYCIIPINPLYWQGTRIKNMAIQYQYYLPKTLSIEYIPTVSKFQAGTVTIGCITGQIINQDSIQQTLISSTSGESFSCSEYFKKNIALNSLLQQKKLLLSPVVDKETVPFYIIVYLSGVTQNGVIISPGSIYMNYSFEFFNPITETLIYKTENSIKMRDIDFEQQNITAILMEQNGQFGVGTKIDIEMINGLPIYKYNNLAVDLDLEKYIVALYSSSPDSMRRMNKFDLREFLYASTSRSITMQVGQQLLIIDDTQATFSDYLKKTSGSIPVEQGRYYKLITNTPEVVEHLQQAPFTLSEFGSSDPSVMMRGTFYQVEFINQHPQ